MLCCGRDEVCPVEMEVGESLVDHSHVCSGKLLVREITSRSKGEGCRICMVSKCLAIRHKNVKGVSILYLIL